MWFRSAVTVTGTNVGNINMWYVIQTRAGEEQELKQLLEHMDGHENYNIILPLYEDVYRKDGHGHISVKKLFPGYLFLDASDPEIMYANARKTPHFTRVLSSRDESGVRFQTVGDEDVAFIKSFTEDGVMRVSYVHRTKTGRIDRVAGPLEKYADQIKKLDLPHRRAIVETDIFGKHRKLKFGLWTDMDPKLPWVEEMLGRAQQETIKQEIDIGVTEGDIVVDELGVYGDMELRVISVNPDRRTVVTEATLFGTTVHVEMSADNVRVVW